MGELRQDEFIGRAIMASRRTQWNLDTGTETTEVWEGTEEECRTSKINAMIRGAASADVGSKGDGSFQMTAAWSFNSDPDNPDNDRGYVDTLELEVNASMRSIYQSPRYRFWFADFDSITHYSARANQTAAIVADMEGKINGGRPERTVSDRKYHYTSVSGVDTPYATQRDAVEVELSDRLNQIAGLTEKEYNAARNLFIEVADMKVTSFIEYDSVFRRTVTAGHPKAIKANNTGAGMIWTTAELIAFEGIAAALNSGYFALPPDVQWHKDQPRVLAAYGQKTQISYSYTAIKTASAMHYLPYRPKPNGARLIHDPTPTP